MDIRTCAVCRTEFDFDTSGLEGSSGIVVCGVDCAKAAVARRGGKYAIHDAADAVVETDADRLTVRFRITRATSQQLSELIAASTTQERALLDCLQVYEWAVSGRTTLYRSRDGEQEEVDQLAIAHAPLTGPERDYGSVTFFGEAERLRELTERSSAPDPETVLMHAITLFHALRSMELDGWTFHGVSGGHTHVISFLA